MNNIILISFDNNAIKHMITLSLSITLLTENNKDFSSNLGKNLTLGPFYLFIRKKKWNESNFLNNTPSFMKIYYCTFEFPIKKKENV